MSSVLGPRGGPRDRVDPGWSTDPNQLFGMLQSAGDEWSKCHQWIDDDRNWVAMLRACAEFPYIIRTDEL